MLSATADTNLARGPQGERVCCLLITQKTGQTMAGSGQTAAEATTTTTIITTTTTAASSSCHRSCRPVVNEIQLNFVAYLVATARAAPAAESTHKCDLSDCQSIARHPATLDTRRTVNCKLRTANCKLQTVNSKL